MIKYAKIGLILTWMLGGCSGELGFELVDGGIGGTGMTSIGEITGFGSVYVNGVRYNTDTSDVFINDERTGVDQLALGMVVKIEGEVDNNQGVAKRITYDDHIRGPLSDLQLEQGRLTVLNQTVWRNDLTVLAGFNGLSQLRLGDGLAISGFAMVDGSLQASRISLVNDDAPLLRGVLHDYNPHNHTAFIGKQQVDLSHSALINAPLADGETVVLRGRLHGQHLQVDSVQTNPWQLPVGQAVNIKGLVSAVSFNQFVLNGVSVQQQRATGYGLGTANEVQQGVLLSVQGQMGHDNILYAEEIRFDRGHDAHRLSALHLQTRLTHLPQGQHIELLGQNFKVDFNTLFQDNAQQQRDFNLSQLAVNDTLLLQAFFEQNQWHVTRLQRLPTDSLFYLLAPVTQTDGMRQRLHLASIAVETDAQTLYFISNLPPNLGGWMQQNEKKPIENKILSADVFFAQIQVATPVLLIAPTGQQPPILAQQLILLEHPAHGL